MKSEKTTKNLFNSKTARGLVSLPTIIILMCSILAVSIVYENNKIKNQITAQATGLEGVSGFAASNPNPQGKTIPAGTIIDSTKPPSSTPQGSAAQQRTSDQPIRQNRFKVAENDFEIVTIYKNADRSLSVYVNKGEPEYEGEGGKIKSFKIAESIRGLFILPESVSKDMLLDKWSGDPKNIPLSGGGARELSGQCTSSYCIATDKYRDKEDMLTKKTETTLILKDKSVKQSKAIYVYEGKEITREQYDKLKKDGKAPEPYLVPISKIEEAIIGDKKYVTRYEYETLVSPSGTPVTFYEATKVDQETGKIVEFTYGEGDKEITLKTPGGVSILDPFCSKCYWEGNTDDAGLLSRAKTRYDQHASRQFFSTVERVFTEFQGLSYLPTLFMDEDSLLAWRESVDKIFATAYLGTEYWSSDICGQYLDGEGEGIAYAETPQGLAQIGAHIEAVRTEPIIDEKGQRAFIYKITFNVRNGDYEKDPKAPEEMNINVVLKGEKTAKVFRQEQKVKRGSTFGKIGKNAIVQDSPTLFNQVCLTFDEIPFRWKLDNKELCNEIQESAGEPTKISTTTTATKTTEGKVDEINDF